MLKLSSLRYCDAPGFDVAYPPAEAASNVFYPKFLAHIRHLSPPLTSLLERILWRPCYVRSWSAFIAVKRLLGDRMELCVNGCAKNVTP